MNPTTRKYSRSMEEAFPSSTLALQRRNQAAWFEPHMNDGRIKRELELWGMIALAFAAGFVVHALWW